MLILYRMLIIIGMVLIFIGALGMAIILIELPEATVIPRRVSFQTEG